MTELDDRIKELKKLLEIQGSAGNWDYDEYMFGYYNGMALALAVLTDSDPLYYNKPDMFIKDLKQLDKLINSGIILDNERD
jgi:hypothetical protein